MSNGRLTSFGLKILGICLMVVDHVAEFFAFLHIPVWFHWLGRIVAPIFLFTSSEGFIYTRNRKRYLFRLWLGFVVMGIGNTIFARYFSVDNEIIVNNIFGTLFLGVIYMQAIEWLKAGVKARQKGLFIKGIALCIIPIILSLVPMMVLPWFTDNNLFWIAQGLFIAIPSFLMTEGGVLFVLLAVLFYLFHGKKWLQVLALLVISGITIVGGQGDLLTFNYQWMMAFAAIPLILYNGEKGRSMRNFFYVFYPAHIYLFALIAFLMRS